ncbi:dihydrodipicolinate synthase family protein [Hydrogenophaga palleronii]|uniref:dihydrodipicolinate synthase family protein n=1 Tax=Hydrogenophaga palleronii TaxID=65655 RepID=UPI0008250FB1|nr:dihydrodipicolinate synthase family protein [Hydrogenophaga palleronii]
MTPLLLGGVTVATVLPFSPAGAIDWAGYARLLSYAASPSSTTAVFVNGHAGESSALSPEERSDVIRFTRRGLRPGQKLVAGIVAETTEDAVQQAREASAAGADVLTAFPLPPSPTRTDAEVLAHVQAVADAGGLPLALFQYPIGSGASYSTALLAQLAELPSIVAVKEGSDTMSLYEDNWRAIRLASDKVAVLPSNFDWFLAQLAVGGHGLLSGLASLVPQQLHELWDASERNDLVAMRAVSERLYPLVRAIYAQPRPHMYARIKLALWQLGVIDCALSRTVRELPGDDAIRIAAALAQAGISYPSPTKASA